MTVDGGLFDEFLMHRDHASSFLYQLLQLPAHSNSAGCSTLDAVVCAGAIPAIVSVIEEMVAIGREWDEEYDEDDPEWGPWCIAETCCAILGRLAHSAQHRPPLINCNVIPTLAGSTRLSLIQSALQPSILGVRELSFGRVNDASSSPEITRVVFRSGDAAIPPRA